MDKKKVVIFNEIFNENLKKHFWKSNYYNENIKKKNKKDEWKN